MDRAPGPALDAALDELLTKAGMSEASNQIVSELAGLAASLAGLPAATFQVFTRLAEYPQVLARMAMLAPPAERGAVISLSDALPFAWCTIPIECWTAARGDLFERSLELLKTVDRAAELAMSVVETVVDGLIAREPLLTAALRPGEAESIETVTQRFLTRAIDRVRGVSRERYRAQLEARLPAYFSRFNESLLDTLDAPCAAALAALGVWTPGPHDIRQMKTVARTFPTYFAEAYAAWLKEQC
jgi:hypothetical protein